MAEALPRTTDSLMWRMVRPMPVLPLALATAGLLEAPHPYIAVGTEGTKSATEFIPRFHRSFDSFLAWFCGDWERASHATTPPPTRSATPEHD